MKVKFRRNRQDNRGHRDSPFSMMKAIQLCKVDKHVTGNVLGVQRVIRVNAKDFYT